MDAVSVIQEVRTTLEDANLGYKQQANAHRRQKIFNPADLVMVMLRKECFPSGTYSKLSPRKLRPFVAAKRINDNAYIIELPPNICTSSTFKVSDLYSYHPPGNANSTIVSLELSSFEMEGKSDVASNN